MESSFEEGDSGRAARMEAMMRRTEPWLAEISRLCAEALRSAPTPGLLATIEEEQKDNAEYARPTGSAGDAIEERLTAALSTLSDSSKSPAVQQTKMMLEDVRKEKAAHREERLLLEAKKKEVEALEGKLMAAARKAREKRANLLSSMRLAVASMALGALVVFFVARQGTPPASNGLDVFRYIH